MARYLILLRNLLTYWFLDVDEAVYGALYDSHFYHIVEFLGMIFRCALLLNSDSKAGIFLRYSSAPICLPAQTPYIAKFCVVLHMSGMAVYVEDDRRLF